MYSIYKLCETLLPREKQIVIGNKDDDKLNNDSIDRRGKNLVFFGF
jgi:hypothetical protein